MNQNILVTGCAGFIGMHLSTYLLKKGYQVIGLDNMNNYYDTVLKNNRLKNLLGYSNFIFFEKDICDASSLKDIFKKYKPYKVVNLAAQAGVRYSLENPASYINSNIVGFINVLENCKHYNTKGLIYASSSSVYGRTNERPFKEEQVLGAPSSIYAVTKLTNELMAKTYSHLYNLRTTGLRYFTVYGPWGRPDMAMYKFVKKILKDEEIELYNFGKMKRDFTYIDDIVQGTVAALNKNFKCEIFNLGNNKTEDLLKMLHVIENSLGKKAKVKLSKMNSADVEYTSAGIEHSEELLGYKPLTEISKGIPKFISWFKKYNSQ